MFLRVVFKIQKTETTKGKNIYITKQKSSEYKKNIEVREKKNQTEYIYINKMSNNSFKVFYSFNWDGGGQERDTAIACVKNVFKDAKVEAEGSQEYPITVKIVRSADSKTVWEGSQKSLFRKYAENRANTIKIIMNNLKKLA